MTFPQTDMAQHASLGPACKAQDEERRVYLGPIEILSGLGLSAKCSVIEHPWWPLTFLAALDNSQHIGQKFRDLLRVRRRQDRCQGGITLHPL